MRYALEPPKEGHIWDFYFDLLLGFVDRKGHADVPRHHIEKGFALGIWVHKQRYNRRYLSPERIAALEEIECWFWEKQPTSTSTERVSAPMERSLYREYAGSGREALRQPDSASIFERPRPQRTDSALSDAGDVLIPRPTHSQREERETAEEQPAEEHFWKSRYELLVQYMNREGHCLVPRRHKEDRYKLGKWVEHQRRLRFAMPEQRRAMLEALQGWSWEPVESPWMFQFTLLRDYSVREGTARVSKDHVEAGYRLGVWLEAQRQKYRCDELSEDRAAMLESLPEWTWCGEADPEALPEAGRDDIDAFVDEVWKILVGHGTVRDVMAAHIAVQARYQAGSLPESTVRLCSEELARLHQAFERGVELGMMERPSKGTIRAIPA